MKGSSFLIVSFFLGIQLGFSQTDTTDFNTVVDVSYKVKKLARINSENAEFSPVVYGDQFIFVSDRETDLVRWGEDFSKRKKHLKIFKAKYFSPNDDTVQLAKIELWNDALSDAYHSGPIAFHPSGNFAVVTRVSSEKKLKTNKPQLYLLKKVNDKWSKPERLHFCGNNFSYGHAAFSDDGKKLFFASDQLGTEGGKDIFVCDFDGEKFSAPQNCGKTINTASDEMYPFFKDQTLYFSSNKAGGIGGLDVYMSTVANNEFGEVVNLGNTINSAEDDFGFFLTSTGRNGFYSSSRKDFSLGGDDIYFFTVNKSATVVSKNISGRFTYSRLSDQIPSGLELQLLDEAGNVVQVTKTDEKGHFKFSNLPPDQDFTIKLVELSPDLVLHIFNKNGEEIAVFMSDTKGTFVYRKLGPEEVGSLAFMQMDEAGINGVKTGHINGQFVHERLLNETVEGLNVMLVDEAGNVHYRTKTDKNGNFSFYKLDPNSNYFISTDSHYDDLKLLLYNDKDQVIAELKRKMGASFIYRKLDGELENQLSMLENEDVSLFPPNYSYLKGKFNFEKMTDVNEGIDFLVMDEAGNVIGKTRTDKNGNFILTGLPNQDVYIFKMADNEAGLDPKNFKLQMLSRFDQELQTITSNDAGLYIFRRNTKNENSVTVPNGVTIYFDKNKVDLDANAYEVLKPLIDLMKQNKNWEVQLDAHTDASANDQYNMNLSMRRMLSAKQYFVRNGINSKRIKGNYHGEKQLVNSCTDASQCTDEQNRLNRRCTAVIVAK